MKTTTYKTKKMVCIALLTAVSSVLMAPVFELPMAIIFPFMPPFLKLDISSVPIMIGSFMFGPLAGVVMSGIKALLHLSVTSSAGIGELTDFIITSSFAITAGLIYRRNKTKKGAMIASIASVGVVTLVGAVVNYFIARPLYYLAFHFTIDNVAKYILAGIVPFNFIKGVVVSGLTFLLYKRISGLIRSFTEGKGNSVQP